MNNSVKLLMIFSLLFLCMGVAFAADVNETANCTDVLCENNNDLEELTEIDEEILSNDTLIDTEISVDRTFYDNCSVGFNITLSDANGQYIDDEVSFSFNNNTTVFNTVNGKAYVEYENPFIGNGTIVAHYGGNSIYAPSSTTLDRINPFSAILIGNASFDEEMYFHVYLENVTGGMVTLYLGESMIYTSPVEENLAKFRVPCINVGRFNARVSYSGDNQYNRSSAMFSFRTYRGDLKIGSIRTYGRTVKNCDVEICASGNFIGLIDVIFNGRKYMEYSYYNPRYPGFDWQYSWYLFNIPELEVGENNITIISWGDRFYRDLVYNCTINVSKSDVDMYVMANNTSSFSESNYGEVVNLTILTQSFYTGTINVTVADQNFTFKLNKTSEIHFNVTGLLPGLHNLTAYYSGDNVTNPGQYAMYMRVNKLNSTVDLNVSVNDVIYGNDAVITVDVNDTGFINLKIGDDNYAGEIINNRAIFTIANLTPDVYDIEVTYPENVTHLELVKKARFYVNRYDPLKLNTTMEIHADDIYCLENAIINVNLNPAASGEVILTVAGMQYHKFLKNGNAMFNVSDLDSGIHMFKAEYCGDDSYNPKILASALRVNKLTPSLDVIAYDVVEGESISIQVSSDGEGQISCNSNDLYAISTHPLVNGIASFNDRKFKPGTYNATIRFVENDIYREVVKKVTYTVVAHDDSKIDVDDSNFNITVSNNVYGRDTYVDIYFPSNLTGNASVLFSGQVYTVDLTDSHFRINCTHLQVRNYTFKIRYLGDERYNGFAKSFKFEVFKATPKINITVGDIDYMEYATINLSADFDSDWGNMVSIDIDGEVINRYLDENQQLTYRFIPLECRNYTVKVFYNGSERYNSTSEIAHFEVRKINPNIHARASDVDYGQTVKIHVDGLSSKADNLTISINNQTDVVNLTGGFSITYEKSGLDAGSYIAVILFSGDSHYNPYECRVNFTVHKIASNLNLVCHYITVGDAEEIEVRPVTVGQGNITLKVANYTFVRNINDNMAFTLENLKAGNYDVSLFYSGDGNYNSFEVNKSFVVYKKNLGIAVDVKQIRYGETEVIKVRFNSDVTGNVTIRVGDVEITQGLVDGSTQFNVSGLKSGNHTVRISYSGDEIYNRLSTSHDFEVSKALSGLKLDIRNSKGLIGNVGYGDFATVKITINENATGNLTFAIANRTYDVPLINGYQFNITGLDIGRHRADLTYSGDENYEGAEDFQYVKVVKTTPKIVITASDIHYGEAAVIEVNVNATGNVSLTIGNDTYEDLLADNFTAFNVTGLEVGTYQFTVTYLGDDYHNFATSKASVEVLKGNPMLTIELNETPYGEVAKILIHLNMDCEVRLMVDSKQYINTTENGTAMFLIYNLAVGSHLIRSTFAGNDCYNSVSNSTRLTITKGHPKFDISVSDADYGGDVIVTVRTNITGRLCLSFDDRGYTEHITDGIALFNISNLDPGVYNFTVRSFGDDSNYYPHEANSTFKVNKLNSSFTFSVFDVNYGEDVIINVFSNQTGTVRLVIGGDSFEKDIFDGVVSFNISNLNAGDYSANITYLGNEYYCEYNSVASFKVEKVNSSFTVGVSDVCFGYDVIVNVFSNQTGTVRLVIGGDSFEKDISDGIAGFNISNLAAGNYTVSLTFLDNINVYSSNQNVSFRVCKVNSSFTVSVLDVDYGENVTVYAYSNQTGSVKLVIGNDTIEKDIVGGVACFVIPDLDVGSYEGNLLYSGSNNYNPFNVTVAFSVNNLQSNITVSALDVDYGENVTVYVYSNQTGRVTLAIGNDTFEARDIVGGVACFVIPDLDAGTYSADACYLENDRYMASDARVSFKVNKANSTVTVNVSDVFYGDNVTVYVYSNQTGSVKLAIGDVTFEKSIADGVACFAVPDLDAGEYDVNVTYLGNVNFNPSGSKAGFKVSKLTPMMSIGLSNITFGETASIWVAVNAKGKVKLEINNRTYTSDIADGVAAFAIPDLSVGSHNLTASYEANNNYNWVCCNDSLTVSKKASQLTVLVSDIAVGQDALITINLNVKGNVTIYLEGERNVFVLNNSVQIKVPNLKTGLYEVKVRFAGDENFTESESINTFEVFDKSGISANDLTMYYMDKTKFTATVYKADGKIAAGIPVVFKVNNKIIKAKSDSKGKAKISIDLIPKTYSITVQALGKSITKKLTVKQVLTLKTAKVKRSAKKLVLKATLKQGKKAIKNKKIVFKFKGKRYTAKTNSKGLAKVTVKKSVLKKLKVGKKVTYQATYLKNTVKKTSKVKK